MHYNDYAWKETCFEKELLELLPQKNNEDGI
jgi:hypothetical protein